MQTPCGRTCWPRRTRAIRGKVMTTPRDDITGRPNRILEGAKEALAVARGEQAAASLHINGHEYVPATQLDSLLKEREALQARVKELEANSFAERGLRMAMARDRSDEMKHWKARAIRAEQERDEAYERII